AYFEPGYIYGGLGGGVSITAPGMALDGQFLGNTITGPKQTFTPPTPSSLSLAFQQEVMISTFVSPTPPNIIFGSGTLAPADPFALDSSGMPLPLRADRTSEVILSPDLINADGFGILNINNGDGTISVPANVSLTTEIGGKIDPVTGTFKLTNGISFSAANMEIDGHIQAPGGNLSFVAYDFSPFGNFVETPPPDPTRGHFVLGPAASLNTDGLLIDDRLGMATADTLPLFITGGSVSIRGFDTDISAGSLIDVSGGAAISATGGISYGRAGSITIAGGQDARIPSLVGGHLTIEGQLKSLSGSVGGTLNIVAPLVQIGGTTSNADTLLLSPGFFSQGGFSNFSIKGIGEATTTGSFLPGLVIAPGATVSPVAESLLVNFDTTGNSSLVATLLPKALRTPVNLTFSATGTTDPVTGLPVIHGDLVMSEGSSILTDPLASVSLTGDTVAVLGSITAPGGNIIIRGATNSLNLFPATGIAVPTVEIGPDASLSATGTTLLTPNSLGFRTGSVLAGGTITISGNIVAERGSRIAVSGATDILDLAPGYSGNVQDTSPSSPQLIPTRVDSNGGTITLSGGQELFTDATLLGAAGGPSAIGGNLVVSSGNQSQSTSTPLDINLQVTQSGPTIPEPSTVSIGLPVLNAMGQAITPYGYFAADSFNNAGFGSLSLKGTVDFLGPVTITAPRSITVGTAGIIFADSTVVLNAPYVDLGQTFLPPLPASQQSSPFTANGAPFYPAPVYGTGTLNVNAQLIDIGNLSLQNIGTANLVAANGDIRGDGGFDVAGNINLTAGQIYPPTEVAFTIAAYDYLVNGATQQGSITITGSGTRQLPLSAGGTLNIYASNISDNGTLRAPIGTINVGSGVIGSTPIDPITNLNFATTQELTLGRRSVTSVAAVDPTTGKAITIPYGINLNGTAWIDPQGNDITTGGVPAKLISVSAADLADQPGSTIDLSGGGDLYAYRFVSGTGGTNDILNTSSSFAIIPGYQANYAPYAPYNPTPLTGNLGGDQGYVNSTLQIGDQIYLNASNGLAAGVYTLLPARYALLPGAFLVTPTSGTPTTTALQADGSSIVSGYRLSGLDVPAAQPNFTSFQVAPESVTRSRAEYDDSFANTFLKA
ncbi:MAG TPA: hypothetical protein VHY59_07725, partial [Chthoniobacterales bacterium]|nr:hypothetical protein [Chthoniobacterales bacterium]